MPGCERILYNVIGFQPPETERGGKQSPVGVKAARMAAIKISEGFNLGYCRARPGKGPKNKPSILMFVIGGNAPSAEFTSESMRRIEAAGAMPRLARKAR